MLVGVSRSSSRPGRWVTTCRSGPISDSMRGRTAAVSGRATGQPNAIGAASAASGTPNASTSVRACGRSAAHSALTSAITALDRGLVSRPCSANQPRSASIVDSANRSQTRSSSARAAGVRQRSMPSTKASQQHASTWARAAASRWSCAALKIANGSSAAAARRSRRASGVEQVLLAPVEQRQRASRGRAGRLVVAAAGRGVDAAAAGCAGRRRRSTTVSTAWSATNRAVPSQVELAEVVAVAGQQLLGDELQQDGVVALEGGEDVGVGLEAGQPVLGQVAGAAAGLAAGLDGARWRARWRAP